MSYIIELEEEIMTREHFNTLFLRDFILGLDNYINRDKLEQELLDFAYYIYAKGYTDKTLSVKKQMKKIFSNII